MPKSRSNVVPLFLLLLVQSGLSQVTDVSQKVAAALMAYGPVPVTTTTQSPRTVQLCHNENYGHGSHGTGDFGTRSVCVNQTVYDPVTATSNAVLTASNIQVIKSDPISYSPLIRTELPDKLIVGDSLATNCTPDQATLGYSLSTTFQRNASVSLTQTISHTNTVGVSVTTGISSVYGDFHVTGSLSFADGTSSAAMQTNGTTTTVQEQRSGSQAVPAHTMMMIELRTWPVRFTAPFSTTVVVDGDLSQNNKGYKRLSDILPESQRTFPISGKLEADDASEANLVFYDLRYDPKLCPTGAVNGAVVPGFKPDKKLKMTQRIAGSQ
jgi:hypothetical protein